MKSNTLPCLASGMLMASVASAVSYENFLNNQTQFILRSSVQQDNATEFNNSYVSWNYDEGFLELVNDKTNATPFAILPFLNYTLASGNTDEYVSLFPYNTTTSVAENGITTVYNPDGSILQPTGPGDFWKVVLGTPPGTPLADPSVQYGILFDSINFSSWGACNNSTDEFPDRQIIYWQLSPSYINGPPGCATMFLLCEEYDHGFSNETAQGIAEKFGSQHITLANGKLDVMGT